MKIPRWSALAVLVAFACSGTAWSAPDLRNSAKYERPNSGYAAYRCEVNLPGPGTWELTGGLQDDPRQLYLLPPQGLSNQMFRGKRARAVQREEMIQRGRSYIWSITWACQQHAIDHNNTGPQTLDDLDSTKNEWLEQRLDKSPWSDRLPIDINPPYIFLIPNAEFIFDHENNREWVKKENRRLLAVELCPFVDDGKHWVLYTDHSTERVEIDSQLVEQYQLKIRPVMKEEDLEQDPTAEVVYQIIAVRDKDRATPLNISLENTFLDQKMTLQWDVAQSTAGGEAVWEELNQARAACLRPYAGASDNPVLDQWMHGDVVQNVNDRRAARRRRGAETDVFGIMGGRAAMRETLQLRAIGGAEASEAERTIPVDTLQGVQVKSHPYEEMLQGQPGGSLALAKLAPTDRFFIYVAKPQTVAPFLDHGADFLSSIGAAMTNSSIRYDLKQRYLARLGLNEAWLKTFLSSGMVKELAIYTPDLFFIEGTDLTVISRIESPAAVQPMLALIQAPGLTNQGTVTVNVNGREVHWAMRDDLLFISTNESELESALALQANQGAGSLGQSAEFRYMLTKLPVHEPTRAFVYFSDPFIRRLVGPEMKIAQLRRMKAKADMQVLTSAALKAKLDGMQPPIGVDTCVENGYVNEQLLTGEYTIDANLIVHSEAYGELANLTTLAETPADLVTEAEAKLYQQYVDSYTRFWRRYFDPIAMRLDDAPDNSLELETFILPLIDDTLFNGLRQVMANKESGTALRIPQIEPQPVLKLSLNLNEEAWQNMVKGFYEVMDQFAPIDSQILDDLGPGFHLAIHDSDPVIALGSGDIMGVFGANIISMNEEMIFIPVIATLLTRPCSMYIETQNPEATKRFLHQAAIFNPVANRGGWDELEMSLYQVEARDEWIFTAEFGGIVKLRYGLQVEGDYLIIRNIPWSNDARITEITAAPLNAARLEALPCACKIQLPSLQAAAVEGYRAATVSGMGYLYPLLLSRHAGLTGAAARHQAMFGYHPVHPPLGDWNWDGLELSSTAFGSVTHQACPANDEDNPIYGVMRGIQSISLNMQFEESGLRTIAKWKLDQTE
ncbi:hypothetical protein JXA32_02115 [Candidatus Sumerlaeota bacterium]|nr:hypothetical protein [Candidatus Sumerlaeota bacterium]